MGKLRRNSLTFHLTGKLLVTLTLIFFGVTAIQLSLQASNTRRCARAQVLGLAEALYGSLHTSMLANDRQNLREAVAQITQRAPNVRVRIFNKDGVIVFSSLEKEIGERLDPSAESCFKCHAQGKPIERLPPGERTRDFRLGQEPAVGAIRPIENEAACWQAACHAHPPSRRLLGVLDVSLALTNMKASQQETATLMVLTTLFALGAVVFVVVGVVDKAVHKPIEGLRVTLQALESGDYTARFQHEEIEEFACLGKALNRTAQALEKANADLLHWAQTLERRVEEKTAELRQAQEHMLQVERMASLGKLAAVVAHEINNPLASVVTYSKLLLKRFSQQPESLMKDPENKQILESIVNEASRCGEIVANLLLFARKTSARFEPLNLNQVVEKSVFLLKHKMDLSQVKLELDLHPQLPEILGDAAQLQQALVALLVNAIEAMPGGGTLSVRTKTAQGGILVQVSDTGVGIEPEVKARIFEPFFTTKQEEGSKSLGLGLAVVYGIIQRHQGTISVDSAPGQGTTFSLFLPAKSGEKSS